MAQSVRRPGTLGTMDHEPQRDKTRTSYFGNVKNRLGSKLPPGVCQPPQFAKRPWETQPQARLMQEATACSQHQPIVCRPLNHVPHIRNPKLRQYYLQGTSWDLGNALVTEDHVGGTAADGRHSRGLRGETVFINEPSDENKMSHTSTPPPSSSSSSSLLPPQDRTSSSGLSRRLDSDPKENQQDRLETLQPPSPSPEAEYDKLLDVEAVPMPDGQLCLLALPPECCQGAGPDATPYLKLFCRYVTDRKGVVSGILLVTRNKIFFDPCKTHPLVKEHGCEEYLLSYPIDSLTSVSFFSDVSHVHFSSSQQRRRGKNIFHKLRAARRGTGGLQNHRGASDPTPAAPSDSSMLVLSRTQEGSGEEEVDTRDMEEVERVNPNPPLSEASAGGLGVGVLGSAATFCCGGQEVATSLKTDLLNTDEEESSVKSQTSVPRRPSATRADGLMFVRLRVQPSVKMKAVGGLHLGSTKNTIRQEAWLALGKESADELHLYLKHCRPDLCLLEGGEEGEVDRDEEEFVLIEDKEDEEDEVLQRHRSTGEDWEMVLMEDSRDKPLQAIDRDPEGLQNIVETSQILEASHVRELCKELPARTVGHMWRLVYSTSCHGASLKSLYRKLSGTDAPVLILIKDALDEIFGAFLSHPLRPSEAFYGTGETFLFMLDPRFKCFKWTGENSFFIKGDLDCFAIGGGSGHFGLWVDENLYLGRSSPCYTFNNCCLSETDDFRVMEMEVWTFG